MNRFFTQVNGLFKLITATSSYTGSSDEIVSTANDGKIDNNLLSDDIAYKGTPLKGNHLVIWDAVKNAIATTTNLSYIGGAIFVNGVRFGLLHLADVDIVGNPPQPGQVLTWVGSVWRPLETKVYWSWSVAINNANVSNSWLRRQNGTETQNCPYLVTADCVMYRVGVSGRPTDQNDYDFQIYRNGSLFQSYRKNQNEPAVIYKNLNIRFNEGDLISVRASRVGGGNISYPGGTMYFKEL